MHDPRTPPGRGPTGTAHRLAPAGVALTLLGLVLLSSPVFHVPVLDLLVPALAFLLLAVLAGLLYRFVRPSALQRQQEILKASTHFNPVDIVCGLRDRLGHRYDLHRYVDPSTVFIAEKWHEGRPLKALERPGLWNGAMAGWNTVFVEVPDATFAPVKTVLDLLRPEHQ